MITNTKILKVKLADSGEASITYDEILTDEDGNPTINKITIDGGHKVHDDLKRALRNLDYHAALICEQITPQKGKGATSHVEENGEVYAVPVPLSQSDMLILSNIRATGYVIGGGDDESAGATVIAKRKLASGKILNLSAPFTRFEAENGYKYAGKLAEDIEMVAQEAILYLQGKHAPDLQLEMEFKTTKPTE